MILFLKISFDDRAAAPLKDTGRRRDFGKPVRKGGRRDDGADDEGRPRGVGAGRRRDGDDSVVDVVVALDPKRNTGGTSLRVGTSRSPPRRRGSLKKRNRSADREARLEAAIERKTVYLYEYVPPTYLFSNVKMGRSIKSHLRLFLSWYFSLVTVVL